MGLAAIVGTQHGPGRQSSHNFHFPVHRPRRRRSQAPRMDLHQAAARGIGSHYGRRFRSGTGSARDTRREHNVFVLLPDGNQRYLSVSLCETTRTLGRYLPPHASSTTTEFVIKVRTDLVLLLILNGNYYLPKLRGSSGFNKLVHSYLLIPTCDCSVIGTRPGRRRRRTWWIPTRCNSTCPLPVPFLDTWTILPFLVNNGTRLLPQRQNTHHLIVETTNLFAFPFRKD